MFARLSTPTPSLATAARAISVERTAKRRAASRPRRTLRRLMATVAMLFGGLAFLGGVGAPAQAWPWDDVSNLPGIIVNFCGPADIPELSTYAGLDNAFGLNTNADPAVVATRKTVRPDVPDNVAEQTGPGLPRLEAVYNGNPDKDLVIHPSYQRYGYSALTWTNFQQNCASIGFWSSSVTNNLFTAIVKMPTIFTMACIKSALDNPLYAAFSALITPFVALFGEIFKPWVTIFAVLIGLPLVWVKTRGSVSKMLSAALWIAFVMGTYLYITNHTSKVVETANNFVTGFTSEAGCQLVQAGAQNSAQSCSAGGVDGLNNALWRGVPYHTWMLGEVGDDQASRDRGREAAGQIGWSQAILNGLYVGTSANGDVDQQGAEVQRDAEFWNNASYGKYGNRKDGDATKYHEWTDEDAWKHVPFLTNVKFMCNDSEPANGKDGNADGKSNRWNRSACQAGDAGTAAWIGNYRGERYDHRLVAAFTGGIAAFAVWLATGVAALYVAFQKMLFYWILLWAPLFLAIGAIPQRREFAVKYAERALANLIKQCVGVLAVLFVSYAMSSLLFPPPESDIPDLPWAMKPLAAILFFWALLLFAWPLQSILKAAAANDTRVVDKALNAPVDAAKKSAAFGVKAGIVVGAAVLTGGTSLGAAAVGAGAKAGAAGLLGKAGGGAGKLLTKGMKLAEIRRGFANSAAARRGQNKAETDLATDTIRRNPLAWGVGRDGKIPKASLDAAIKQVRKTSSEARLKGVQDSTYDRAMQQQFTAFRQRTKQYHPLDPANPERQNGTAAPQQQNQPGRLGPPAPAWARPAQETRAQVVASDQQVMAAARVATNREAADNLPRVLEQYEWNPGVMDPRHPSTPSLLRLAHAPNDPDSEEFRSAHRQAMIDVNQHGVPDRIREIVTVGETASRFDQIALLNAVPRLDVNPNGDAQWQQRSDAALQFNNVASLVPEDHQFAQRINDFREALANPYVSADLVNQLSTELVVNLTASLNNDPPPSYGDPRNGSTPPPAYGDPDGGSSPPPPPSRSPQWTDPPPPPSESPQWTDPPPQPDRGTGGIYFSEPRREDPPPPPPPARERHPEPAAGADRHAMDNLREGLRDDFREVLREHRDDLAALPPPEVIVRNVGDPPPASDPPSSPASADPPEGGAFNGPPGSGNSGFFPNRNIPPDEQR
jgi:hypothetical protein